MEFTATGENDDLECRALLAGDIGPAEDTPATDIDGDLLQVRDILTAE